MVSNGKNVKELPGRPREFDHNATLAKITQVFWQQGFAKTTYADLEKATGLHRQSLVYAFGDKKALFESAIDYYNAYS
ncbi:MAG: TetR/AcrR family transcriptional regulator [Cyanobacteria bacterium J06623_5]